jgi:hypothetical protein
MRGDADRVSQGFQCNVREESGGARGHLKAVVGLRDDVRRLEWQWAQANRAADGSLPSG